MKYYAYKGELPLGKEPCGSSDKAMFELKTDKGAIKRCKRLFKAPFKLYSYTNFYRDSTFKKII